MPRTTEAGRALSSGAPHGWCGRVAGHGVHLAVSHIQPLHFIQPERARAAAAEDCELIAAFVDGAVAIQTLRECDRFALRLISCDQLGLWRRTESPEAFRAVRSRQLQDPQSVFAVGYVRE